MWRSVAKPLAGHEDVTDQMDSHVESLVDALILAAESPDSVLAPHARIVEPSAVASVDVEAVERAAVAWSGVDPIEPPAVLPPESASARPRRIVKPARVRRTGSPILSGAIALSLLVFGCLVFRDHFLPVLRNTLSSVAQPATLREDRVMSPIPVPQVVDDPNRFPFLTGDAARRAVLRDRQERALRMAEEAARSSGARAHAWPGGVEPSR